MAITKSLVSLEIDYSIDSLTILEDFNPLKDIGVLIKDEETGISECDVWYKSTIFSDKMVSEVQEWVKIPNMPWMKKPTNAVSNRYKGLQMVLDNSTYSSIQKDENGIIIGFTESVDEEHLDSEGNVIEGYYQTFSLFKQYTNIINLMYSTMSKR